MKLIETGRNRTEIFLNFDQWLVRFWVSGPGTPQERRQIGLTISEMVSKTFGELGEYSWIIHPNGYQANKVRDESRGISLNRALKLETDEGRMGFEIRMRRLKNGWTQGELAKRSGVDHSQISRLERGQSRMRELTFSKIHLAFQDFEKGICPVQPNSESIEPGTSHLEPQQRRQTE